MAFEKVTKQMVQRFVKTNLNHLDFVRDTVEMKKFVEVNIYVNLITKKCYMPLKKRSGMGDILKLVRTSM